MEKNTALEAVSTAAAELAQAQALMQARVTEARAAGASWATIGEILGSSKQAAQQKYGKPSFAAEIRASNAASKAAHALTHDEDKAAADRYAKRRAAEQGTAAAAAAETTPETPETTSIFLDPIAPAPRKRRTEKQVLADYEAHRARKAKLPEICPGCDTGRWHRDGIAFEGCAETQNDHEWTDRWPLKLAKPLDGLFVRRTK